MTSPAPATDRLEDEARRGPRAWVAAPFRTLRARILVRFVFALALATAASLLFQRQVLLNEVDRRIEQDLRQEVTELRQLVGGRDEQGNCVAGAAADGRCEVGRNPETGEPFGDDIDAVFETFLRRNLPPRYETMMTFVNGQPHRVPAVRSDFAAAADEHLLPLATVSEPTRGEVATEYGRLRYLAVPIDGRGEGPLGVFAVAQFVDLQTAEVEQALQVAALMGLALLLVAAGLAYAAAGRLLAPVRAVRETARQISETDLSQRIEVSSDDEIGSLARTFNQMLDRLQTAFATQRYFVDDAGHELRTPITIIRGHLELLGDDPDERKETVAIVTDELDRMNRMVDDLIVLARAERPDFLALEAVDVASLTEDLSLKAAALARRDWQTEAVAQGRIVADRQRLTQAVMQLAQNASQHTTEGDVIAIGSAVTGGEARLWVRDSGVGIPAEEQERIFERFSRGQRTRRTEGAGLGLSIVRAIAEAHGGRVEVNSRAGAGATFTLVIPVDPPHSQQGPAR